MASAAPATAGEAARVASLLDGRIRAVELRLDGFLEPPDLPALRSLFPSVTLLATVRSRREGGRFDGSAASARTLLAAALDAGFDLVDVEAALDGGERLLGLPAGRCVASFHDPAGVPADVEARAALLSATGARFAKLVATPQSAVEALALLDLQRRRADGRLSVLGMGERGLLARALAPWLGAALSFGSLDPAAPTAPGQLAALDLLETYAVGRPRVATGSCLLAGGRVSHSFSPALHDGWLETNGIPLLYLPVALASFGEWDAVVAALDRWGLPVRGASVTIPWKGDAARRFPCPGEEAVNTLVRSGPGFVSANTDRTALLEAIPAASPGDRALLLGAGGMAVTAASVLAARAYRLEVAARRPEVSRLLARRLGGEAAELAGVDGRSGATGRPYRVVVNATPLGLDANDPLPCAPGLLGPGVLVVDAPYRPGGTLLVREARARGAEAVDGFSLLAAQAASQAALFTGRPASASDLTACLPERLRTPFEVTA